MGSIDKRPLKAFVRFDGSGRIVASSLILRRKKPKVGKWVEIPPYECCNPVPAPQCVEYSLEVLDETVAVTYTDCDGILVETEFTGPSTEFFCAQFGTVTTNGENSPLVYGSCTGGTTTTTSTSSTTTTTTTTAAPTTTTTTTTVI